MLYIGTSGFKFADWKDTFYPAELKEKDWLNYYGERFNTLEVNASYYRLIHPATYYQMARKVPEGFLFTVKTYRSLTHEIGAGTEADFDTFIESLRPLIEAEKFGCVLAQFPNSFRNTSANREYLARFRERFAEYPLVIEFRHREWLTDETFAFLRDQRVGFCGVDEPQFRSLMPPLAVATSDTGYVRFHGRNYQDWWKGEKDKRYDYLYTEEELREWVPKIRRLDEECEKTFAFMNNCFGGKAARNALDMQRLLLEG